VLVLSGAGLSVESGLSTFRGDGGLWRQHRPEDLATPEAFIRDPGLVWEWYSERRRAALEARPNDAHRALAELQSRRGPDRVGMITQNVDGLLQRAGACDVIEFHGSLFRVRCSAGCGGDCFDQRTPWPHPVPCVHCGASLRPGVVWFGEPLAEPVLTRSFELAAGADAVLVVGTSGLVEPAASLAGAAAQGGAAVVEVNPESTPVSAWADVTIRGAAAEVVPALVAPWGPGPRSGDSSNMPQ